MTKKILFLTLFSICQISLGIAQTESLKFIIRVDDILNRNTTILPRSIIPFQDSVASRGGKITWGVIPHRLIESANADGVLATELKATVAAGHELSLHGFDHLCDKCQSIPGAAFWGHEMFCTTLNQSFTKEEQTTMIREGLDIILEEVGIVPTSFIPPGHISDETTIEVLSEQNLTYFSNDKDAEHLTNGVFNFPINEEFTWALTNETYQNNLENALEDIKSAAAETGIYGLMLHDHFIRSGYNDGIVLDWMTESLDSLNVYFGDDIEYLTLTEAAESIKGQFVSIEQPNEIVQGFTLHQNYPNPFNPSTNISFTLDNSTRVNLLVYNLQGQLVSALINSTLSAGKHDISFDASNLPSGQYFYSLSTVNGTITKSMTLIK
jgi:hypothetical protein